MAGEMRFRDTRNMEVKEIEAHVYAETGRRPRCARCVRILYYVGRTRRWPLSTASLIAFHSANFSTVVAPLHFHDNVSDEDGVEVAVETEHLLTIVGRLVDYFNDARSLCIRSQNVSDVSSLDELRISFLCNRKCITYRFLIFVPLNVTTRLTQTSLRGRKGDNRDGVKKGFIQKRLGNG